MLNGKYRGNLTIHDVSSVCSDPKTRAVKILYFEAKLILTKYKQTSVANRNQLYAKCM